MKQLDYKGLLLGLSVLLCTSLHSQVTFQKTFGGTGDDVANWVANTSTGYIVAGYTTTASGNRDGYLLNLDFSGNTIWQKRIGGDQRDQFNVVYETDGGFLVLGETESYGAGDLDAWLLKISPAGSILWSRTLGSNGTTDLGNSMLGISGNRILISGAQAPVGSTGFNSNLYLLDAAGQLIWSQTYASSDIGNLMRCNYVENSVAYVSGGIETEGGYMRIDVEHGNIIDTKSYPGNSTEALYYQQPAGDGNIILSDHTWSATNGAQIKQWVNKVTPDGQTIWSKVYSRPNDNLRGRIELAGDGNFLLTPYDGLFSNDGDALLAKIDEGGNVMWSRNYGRPGLDWLWKAQLAPDGGFIAVGATTSDNGDRDVLIVKTDYEGLITGCCIPKAGIVAENYDHPDNPVPLTRTSWVGPEPATTQQVNANLVEDIFCSNPPVEVFNDLGLCPNEFFVLNGVEYYAPDEVIVTLPGLFGCDTIVHYAFLLLDQVERTETIALCEGDSVAVQGAFYFAPDTVTYTVPTSSGCDTLVTVNLVINTDPTACLSCRGTFLKIIGDAGQNVRGHGVYDAGDGNLYVTGTKQDSAIILKMTPTGFVLWSRTFDIIQGLPDNIAELLVDSEGMLVGAGQSGDEQPIAAGFVFRYNPLTSNMLWTSLLPDNSAFVMGVVELSPGGNFLVYSNPHAPDNNAQLTEVSRADGAFVNSPMSKLLDVGSSDNFNSMMVSNGKLYGVGRFTGGIAFTDMRHTIARFDIGTGQLDYMQLGHFFLGPPARLYGMDFTLEDGLITSVGFGDQQGEDLNNSNVYLYRSLTQTGVISSPTVIDFLEMTGDAVDEIVKVPGGHVLLCHSLFQSPADLYFVKIDMVGNVVWSKKLDYGFDQLLPVSIVQSQIMVKGNFIYCVATTTNAAGEQRMMVLKMTLDGKMDGDCEYLKNTPVTADLAQFASGQDITPTETPLSEILQPQTVAVAQNNIGAEFLCRELIEDQVIISLCAGDSITLGGQVYTEADTVVVSISNPVGCDSTVTYIIEVLPQITRSETIEFCQGDGVTLGGQTYFEPDTVVLTLPGITGCDTLVTYYLALLPQNTRSETIEFCAGESVTLGGITYTESTEVTVTLPSSTACDTVVTYHLTVIPAVTKTENVSFCPGTSVLINGESYSAAGTVVDTLTAASGCDSIVTYQLSLLPQPTRSETIKLCPGESVVLGGQTYSQPGTVTLQLPATTGCDTLVTYTIASELPSPSVVNIHCPANVSLIADPGTAPLAVNYTTPTADTDCPCPGMTVELTAGLPSGGLFPNGITQVCYKATDACGHSATCCFTVTVREIQPCDVKETPCVRYELLSITADPGQNLTYRIRVINNCANKLIYTAIQLPDGVVAMEPAQLSVFTAESGRKYDVRNPNFSPFYSIRFKSMADSISNGQSDIFQYTLPAQSAPLYMDITSRLATQVFYEAHLNTFYCPIGVTPTNGNRDIAATPASAERLLLFPNPSDGTLWVDLSQWSGQHPTWRIFNSQGQQVLQNTDVPQDDLLRIDLPQGLPVGLYFFEIQAEDGKRETLRFLLKG